MFVSKEYSFPISWARLALQRGELDQKDRFGARQDEGSTACVFSGKRSSLRWLALEVRGSGWTEYNDVEPCLSSGLGRSRIGQTVRCRRDPCHRDFGLRYSCILGYLGDNW